MEELQLITSFEDQPDASVEVFAYVFDRSGELVAREPLKGGKALLGIDAKQLRRARIFFAPAPEQRREILTLDDMESMRAYEPVWEFEPERRAYELPAIPGQIWQRWLLCPCRVRGRVVRPVAVDGTTHELPVCHARVHLAEVDAIPRLILRLPDNIIRRVRDELLVAIQHIWPPIPDPDPDPIFEIDLGVIDPSPVAIAQMNRPEQARIPGLYAKGGVVQLSPRPEPPPISIANLAVVNPQPEPPDFTVLADLTAETRAALSSDSPAILRETLAANAALLRPYICRWPWLWYYYRCDELRVLYTNHQGRFDTTICYPCRGDRPDLYFWVEFCIGGTWTTVYKRPIPCSTYWNFVSGSEVTIRISDVRVPWCADTPPLPGRQIAVLSIGYHVSLAEIQGAAAGANEGLTTAGEPFGGSLEPHVWFGDDLIASGVTHYRWSYRRLGSSGGWVALDRQVVRHYAEIAPDKTLVFKPFPLGPDPALAGQTLFKIQPESPPTGAWAPVVDARENTASGFFLTHLLESGDAAAAAGKYELKLELFHADGTLINLTDAGILVKESTSTAPFGPVAVPTALAPAEHLLLDPAGKVVGYRLVLHVDNSPCEGEIYDVGGSDLTLDPCCGYFQYGSHASVELAFKARHPRDFATFEFATVRGNSNPVGAASASGSAAASQVNGFTRGLTGIYRKTGLTIMNLLGGCDKGAFAETLHVYALATDGWSRLWHLDSYPPAKAFALEPKEKQALP